MKVQLAIFYFVSTVWIQQTDCAERAVWISGESGAHSDHPGKCWLQSLSREFRVGEEFTDTTKCELLRCRPSLQFARQM